MTSSARQRADIRLQLLDHGDRRIVAVAHREQDFEAGIILLEKRSQVGFQSRIEPGQRLQDADQA